MQTYVSRALLEMLLLDIGLTDFRDETFRVKRY